MDRTITVTGSGTAYAKPDQVKLNGELCGECGSYSEAVTLSAESVAALKKAVGDAGFDMDALKTTGLSVSASYSQKDGVRTFEGYRFFHVVSMTVDLADGGLGKLLDAVMNCPGAPEFSISYVVSDPSRPMAEARIAAVKDAKHRAKELADAAGVKLGQIATISYVSSPCNLGRSSRAVMLCACDGITPEDAEYSDSVSIEWTLLD